MGISKQIFEETCKEVRQSVYNNEYKFTGAKACPTLFLKPQFQKIAEDYFPYHIKSNRKLFPAVIIQMIAIKMVIPVTDLLRF